MSAFAKFTMITSNAVSATAFYVGVYTMWLKRRSSQNIVIGGAAGAFPPMIGWAAVTGHLDLAPIVLFLLTRSLVKNALAPRVLVTIIYATAILLLSFILNGLMTKAAVFALSLSAFLWVTWSWTFTSSQRLRVRSWLKHAPVLAYLR